jgi:uncharacterized membrane protein YhiD involved in acid resistance
MSAGAGLYAVAVFSTGLVLFALVVLSWCEQRFGLRARVIGFRITANHSEALAGEVQRLLQRDNRDAAGNRGRGTMALHP